VGSIDAAAATYNPVIPAGSIPVNRSATSWSPATKFCVDAPVAAAVEDSRAANRVPAADTSACAAATAAAEG
jgi:hypothetical protein